MEIGDRVIQGFLLLERDSLVNILFGLNNPGGREVIKSVMTGIRSNLVNGTLSRI